MDELDRHLLPVEPLEVPAAELAFHRLSGRVCLDLVATIGERWRGRFERLRSPEDLTRWLTATFAWFDGAATDDDLTAARRLRGAIELVAVAAMAGTEPQAAALAEVNATACEPGPSRTLVALGEVTLHVPAGQTAVGTALAAVAHDAVDLFGSDLADRVGECSADDCALVFLDTSRGRRRRWCSMDACGNRAKVRRHRRTG